MIIYVRESVEPISIEPHAILAEIHGLVHGPCMDPCAPSRSSWNVFATARDEAHMWYPSKKFESLDTTSQKPKLEKRNSRFTRKQWITKILERWLLVEKKVPYKFPNDIPLQLLTLRVVNGRFIFLPKYSNAHSSDTGPGKKKKKLLCKFTY